MNIAFDHLTGVRYPLPFQTLSVPFSQLKKDDMVIEQRAGVTIDSWVFYRIVRINKKTITLRGCNRDGLPYRYDKPIRKAIQSWNYTIRAPHAEE
jgi:hypothetical protein